MGTLASSTAGSDFSIHLATSSKDLVYSLQDKDNTNSSENELMVLHNKFIASSENGVMVGKGSNQSWLCTVPESYVIAQ